MFLFGWSVEMGWSVKIRWSVEMGWSAEMGWSSRWGGRWDCVGLSSWDGYNIALDILFCYPGPGCGLLSGWKTIQCYWFGMEIILAGQLYIDGVGCNEGLYVFGGRGRTPTDADGRGHFYKIFFYYFFCAFFFVGIHWSTGSIGTRPRGMWNVELATVSLRWPNGPNYVAPTSPTYDGRTVLLTLGQRSCAIWAVPTSTIYTIRRSTCLINDPPISIESNRIVSYLFLYWSIPVSVHSAHIIC